ncbi:hypothetical protein QZJ86_14690 [Methylomonas montana]|uniref:hypothetical protein n=1 Tax=Methylomonas montana TaxID=3058963 RepID=UPI00265AAB01|nr:hypothetical protein [Methylomonas montana]WKJ89265.1 hypothetical protein QZJ86_14690 [Methylomonas montana]
MRQPDYSAIIQILRGAVAFFFIGLTPIIPAMAFAAGHMGHMSIHDSSGLPGDFLLFPDVTGIVRYDQEPRKKLSNSEVIPAINVFYTADYQRFRFLGEWLVSTKTHNLERFQLGVHVGEDASLWLGRFHNPIGYWNMQFHHGAFLQTTISRPGIMAFETAGGVIPNHLTGFLWEGVRQFGEAGVYYTVGAGAGPQINKGLEAFNLIEPGGSHRPSASFRLGYQPVSYGIDEFGVSGAYNQIHSDELSVKNVNQFVASAYANKQIDSVRLLSEVVYVNNSLESPQGAKAYDDFLSAYGQVEWALHPRWTLVGRVEGTFGASNDPYLAMFPKFVEDRFLGGVRYQVNHNMALKLEASRDHLRDDHFGQVMFQWSAVFP